MSYLIVLLVLWAIVTVVGHTSWLAIAMIGRAVSGSTESHSDRRGTASGSGESPERTLESFSRVVERLVESGKLGESDGRDLKRNAERIVRPAAVARAPLSPASLAQASAGPSGASADAVLLAELVDTAGGTPSPRSAVPPTDPIAPPVVHPPVVDPDAVDSSRQARHEPRTPEGVRTAEDLAPSMSWSQVITAFLAARNIRWGELAAGMMIVICSIGLVVSLWSTLTATHRAVPSLIFMAANASIFAAGLYTFGRWRTRATSRAVLIIASLLVPLSVLAGLAATGDGGMRVSLSDPIALAAIVLGGGVYGWLLLKTGRVLVGRVSAGGYALGIIGPTLMLPAMPTLVRVLGPSSGWCVLIGAIVTTAAWLSEPWRRSRRAAKAVVPPRGGTDQTRRFPLAIGRRGFAMRAMRLSTGTFAFACLVAYVAVGIARVDRPAGSHHDFLPLALSAIPVLVALMASSRHYALQCRFAVHALTGNSVAVFAALAVASLSAATLGDAGWLWAWGGIATSSGLAVAAASRRSSWVPMALVPLSLAVVMTSTSWLGTDRFETLAVWRRMISAPAMLVAVTLVVTAGLARHFLLRRSDRMSEHHRGFRWLTMGYALTAIVIGTALLLGPTAWRCGIPVWLVAGAMSAAWATLRFAKLEEIFAVVAPGFCLLGLAHGVKGFDPSFVLGLEPMLSTKLFFSWSALLSSTALLSRRSGGPRLSGFVDTASVLVAIALPASATFGWAVRMMAGVLTPPPLGTPIVIYGLPVLAWLIGLAALFIRVDEGADHEIGWRHRIRRNVTSDALVGTLILWIGCAVGWLVMQTAVTQLVTAVSVVGLLLGLWALTSRRLGITPGISIVVGGVFAIIASTTLIGSGWVVPLSEGASIGIVPTTAVIIWWIVAAVVSLAGVARKPVDGGIALASVLIPAAAVLAMPWLGWRNPITLMQGAGVATFLWMSALQFGLGRIKAFRRRPLVKETSTALEGLWSATWIVGVGSCILTMVAMIFQLERLDELYGTASIIVSSVAVAWWAFGVPPTERASEAVSSGHWNLRQPGSLPWPIAVSLLPGQIASLLFSMDWATSSDLPLVMAGTWAVAGIASTIRYAMKPRDVDALHAMAVGSIATWVSVFDYHATTTVMVWPGMAGLVSVGV